MNTIERILQVFQAFRMPATQIDEFEKGGRELLLTQLSSFVDRNQPIEFMMLGYPFKSTNHRDKTIGVLPDFAEEVSFQNFRRFATAMEFVHAPGVHINLLSDGYVFNDILEETDRTVEEYGEVSTSMAKGAPVTLMSLRDFYRTPLPEARSKVLEQFGVSETELERRILLDANTNALYRGMIRFMEEELANRTFASKRQHHLAAKALARAMMFRNEAYSQLATTEFPNRIRLSMHPSTNNGKYSFQLIPSPKAWTSPWHCALLIESDGTYATVHRKDAELAGHELVLREGRPYYYQQH